MNFLRFAPLALGLATLTACDQVETLRERVEQVTTATTSPSTESAATPELDADDTFALLRTETDTTDENPTFCLVFSEPLDPQRDYEPFIGTRANLAVAAQGQQLCLQGLRYGDETSITVRQGLPAASGATLDSDETVQVTFGERPAVVQFAGNGIILPRTGGEGLAITTVNVDSVDVTITRLNDRAIALRRITEGFNANEGDWGYMPYGSRPDEFGERVFEGTLETPGVLNEVTATSLPIRDAVGKLEPGAYLVEIEDSAAAQAQTRNPARAARWVIVTDLAMTAYRGSTGLDVTVRSLQNARPQSGQLVKLIAQSNEVLAEARTSRDGRVRFDAPLLAGRDGNRAKLITVEGRSDFAMLDLDRAPLDLSTQPVGGAPSPDVATAYVYLDRGIYRPGETVHASALVRDVEGYAIDDRPGALVLYRPNGLEQRRLRFERLEDAGGLVTSFDLPRSASRGVWRIATELDGLGEVGSTRLNVEDFVPQRMKLSLEADTETPMRAGDRRMIEADVQFLYGAPGAGLTINGDARMDQDPSPFEEWPGYSFSLAQKPFRQQIVEIEDAVTDGSGLANIALAPAQTGAKATEPLRLRTVIRAEEPGGRAIQDDIIIPYRPRKTYVGLKPDFEGSAEVREPVTFNVAALDANGEAVSREVTWHIRRRVYDYDWYQERNGRWRWRRSERRVTEARGTVLTGNEATKIVGPRLSWGDYDIELALNGEPRTSQRFWVGYSGRARDGAPAPDSVRVMGPSDPVKVGETTSVAIKAPYAGMAEIAVASAGIISLQHITLPEDGREIEIPVTEDWGAGAYVLVNVYTDRDPDDRPVPRRAVGAVYIPIDVDDRTYDIAIEADELARPNASTRVTLTVPDAPEGAEMFATLAAVDEGILLLTKHKNPDPVKAFFGKRRLGIDLYDDYGRLLDPNMADAGVLRSGGDSIGGAGLTAVPTKSVVLFNGPIALNAAGKAELELDLPDFNGALRLMAVTWSDEGVGATAEKVTVRDPVPAELILPRFLAPGDEAIATLTIDNVEGAEGSYQTNIAAAAGLNVVTKESARILTAGERQDQGITLQAEDVGVTSIDLTVDGPDGFQATSSYPFEVRGAFLPVRQTTRVTLAPGESYTPAANSFDAFAAGSGELFITASSSPIDTQSIGATLMRYPYACTEQLVSRASPKLFNRQRTAKQQRELQADVDALLERQSPDGAFGMWRVGDRRASPWLGAYATDFLARAKTQGLIVPDEAMKRAYRALQSIAQGEMRRAYGYDGRVSPSSFSTDTVKRLADRAGAYALYVLARAGQADRTRLRYVHDAQLDSIESPLARAQVGAALAALGDQGRAKSAFRQALEGRGYDNPSDWYQSPVRDNAGIAALLAEAGQLDQAVTLIQGLDRQIDLDRLRTQEQAFLLRAARSVSGGDDKISLRYDGSLTNAALVTDAENLDRSFSNEGDGPLFLTVQATGIPASAPAALASEIVLQKDIFNQQGQLVTDADLNQGDRMIVRISLTPQREGRAQYVISDLLPAGLEIESVLGPQDGSPNGAFGFLGFLSEADVAEARDDRFVASHILRGRELRQYAYIARAVTPGKFTRPGAVAEDMYRPDVYARTAAGTLTIQP
ncbi:MAG: alpha-2-macroglobulin family protein [Parvularculaceae bacterium]|nr:alpha-2-macroglobulin family protein [Parvularculaceae bacterium]